MNNTNTLIILPAYNVEKEICNLLYDMMDYKADVIVIDDGSKDNTFEIANSLEFKVIKLEINQGVANAIKVGINYAIERGYKNILLMDSDGQHSPKYINKFLDMLKDFDFIVGNRFNCTTLAPDIKLGSNILASIIVKKIVGEKFTDISCGFKAIKLSDDLSMALKNSEGYSIVFDLFFYALNHNYRIGTVDMEAIYDYSTFLITRTTEILAFISSLELHISKELIANLGIRNLKNKVLEHKDFFYEIEDFKFYGFYIDEKNGYIIQSDPIKLRKYLSEG